MRLSVAAALAFRLAVNHLDAAPGQLVARTGGDNFGAVHGKLAAADKVYLAFFTML